MGNGQWAMGYRGERMNSQHVSISSRYQAIPRENRRIHSVNLFASFASLRFNFYFSNPIREPEQHR